MALIGDGLMPLKDDPGICLEEGLQGTEKQQGCGQADKGLG